MSRGALDDASLRAIARELPMINDLYTRVIGLSPDIISANFGPHSTVAIASVCLEDSVSVLTQACYAVEEALAHRAWYREKARPSDEMAAVFYSRFYIDDAALRLYAAGEHLAAAIIFMLEIDSAQLESYRRRRSVNKRLWPNS